MIHKSKTFLIFSFIYLLTAIGAFAYITSEVNRVGAELESKVKVVADSYAKEIKFTELNELVESTGDEREQLKKYMLSEEDTIIFLSEIERVGVEQGVSLVTNALNVRQNSDGNDELNVQLSISGQPELVSKMLSILENLPYQSSINTLSLAEVEDGETKLDVAIDLLLF